MRRERDRRCGRDVQWPWTGAATLRDPGGSGPLEAGGGPDGGAEAPTRLELSETGWAARAAYGVAHRRGSARPTTSTRPTARRARRDRGRAGAVGPGRHAVARALETHRRAVLTAVLTAVLPGATGRASPASGGSWVNRRWLSRRWLNHRWLNRRCASHRQRRAGLRGVPRFTGARAAPGCSRPRVAAPGSSGPA